MFIFWLGRRNSQKWGNRATRSLLRVRVCALPSDHAGDGQDRQLRRRSERRTARACRGRCVRVSGSVRRRVPQLLGAPAFVPRARRARPEAHYGTASKNGDDAILGDGADVMVLPRKFDHVLTTPPATVQVDSGSSTTRIAPRALAHVARARCDRRVQERASPAPVRRAVTRESWPGALAACVLCFGVSSGRAWRRLCPPPQRAGHRPQRRRRRHPLASERFELERDGGWGG